MERSSIPKSSRTWLVTERPKADDATRQKRKTRQGENAIHAMRSTPTKRRHRKGPCTRAIAQQQLKTKINRTNMCHSISPTANAAARIPIRNSESNPKPSVQSRESMRASSGAVTSVATHSRARSFVPTRAAIAHMSGAL